MSLSFSVAVTPLDTFFSECSISTPGRRHLPSSVTYSDPISRSRYADAPGSVAYDMRKSGRPGTRVARPSDHVWTSAGSSIGTTFASQSSGVKACIFVSAAISGISVPPVPVASLTGHTMSSPVALLWLTSSVCTGDECTGLLERDCAELPPFLSKPTQTSVKKTQSGEAQRLQRNRAILRGCSASSFVLLTVDTSQFMTILWAVTGIKHHFW